MVRALSIESIHGQKERGRTPFCKYGVVGKRTKLQLPFFEGSYSRIIRRVRLPSPPAEKRDLVQGSGNQGIGVVRLNCTRPSKNMYQGQVHFQVTQGTPPHHTPRAVPRVETKVAQDLGVKIRDFGIKIRDWTGKPGKRQTPRKSICRDDNNRENKKVASPYRLKNHLKRNITSGILHSVLHLIIYGIKRVFESFCYILGVL